MKKRVRFLAVAFLCGLAFAMPVPAADPVPSRVGALSWQNTRTAPTLSLDDADQAAIRYLGPAAVTLDQSEFVQITDAARYGDVAKTVLYGWRLHYSGLVVKHPRTGASVILNLSVLIDGGRGRDGLPTKALIAAFTDTNPDAWQPPVLKPRDYTVVMQDDGWNVSPLQTTPLSSTISAVLASFWANSGINPASAGQVMLRPMLANPALPAKRKSYRLEPLWPGGMYWTVLVSGTKTHVITGPDPATSGTPNGKDKNQDRYMSGLIALYSDIGARSVRGVYLP